MAKEMPAIAYFRARLNDQAPLFAARFAHDADAMRKHPEFFECDAEGKALDGVTVAQPKFAREVEEEVQAVVIPQGGDSASPFVPVVKVNGVKDGKAIVRKPAPARPGRGNPAKV